MGNARRKQVGAENGKMGSLHDLLTAYPDERSCEARVIEVALLVGCEYLEHVRAERLDVERVRLGSPGMQVVRHAVHVVVLADGWHRRGMLPHPRPEVVPHLVERVASLLEVLYLLYNHLLEHPALPSLGALEQCLQGYAGCRLPSRLASDSDASRGSPGLGGQVWGLALLLSSGFPRIFLCSSPWCICQLKTVPQIA